MTRYGKNVVGKRHMLALGLKYKRRSPRHHLKDGRKLHTFE
jgi:hypothetical protein